MTFEVHTPEGSHAYADDARYDVEHPGAGLLAVWTPDGRKIIYGPGGWCRLEEHPTDTGPS